MYLLEARGCWIINPIANGLHNSGREKLEYKATMNVNNLAKSLCFKITE